MSDDAAAHATEPRAEMRRGVLPTTLGGIGTVVGLLAASTLVPDCAVSEGQAERLHVALPVSGAVLLATLGGLLLVGLLRLASRRGLVVLAAGCAVAAALVFDVIAALVYDGTLGELGPAFLVFGVLHLGMLAAVLVITGEVCRPRSGVTRNRRVVGMAAATIGPLELIHWSGPTSTAIVPSLAAVTWSCSVLACILLLVLVVGEERAIAALMPKARAGDVPYRAPLPEPEDPRLAAHREARRFFRRLFVVAMVTSALAFMSWRRLPAKPHEPTTRPDGTPVHFNFGWGC